MFIHTTIDERAKALAERAARPYGGASRKQLQELFEAFKERILWKLEEKFPDDRKRVD